MNLRKYYIEVCFVLLSLLLLSFLILNNKTISTTNEETQAYHNYEYGINLDSLQIYRDTIKQGQSLSVILNDWGISAITVEKLCEMSKDSFDLKSIKAGNPYAIICTADSIPKALYMIYEKNNISYVVFALSDSLKVYTGKKDLEKTIKTTSGLITSTLWDAIETSKSGIDLALLLPDIYAWSIDFYSLQKGDWFKVIYEEMSVDEKVIGISKVIASLFHSEGKTYSAFWYEQDSIGEYYDEEGQSLRRAFLKAPLKFTRISSKFSHSRLHPVLKYRRPHLGVDYSAPSGTPVYSVGAGTVIKAGYSGQAGLMVKIRHNSTYETAYLHLSRLGSGIRLGSKVTQGQTIGYVGSTGLATGPHLDFRFYKNGTPIDPLKVESPPAKPIDSTCLPEFIKYKDDKLKELNLIELKQKKKN